MRKRIETRDESGQTMVEFALVLPILVVIVFAIVQFGIAFNNYVTVTDAARAGARVAAVSRQASNPVGACQTAAVNAASGLNMTQPGAGVICTFPASMQPGTTVQVEVDYPYTIDLFGIPITSGTLQSIMKERLE